MAVHLKLSILKECQFVLGYQHNTTWSGSVLVTALCAFFFFFCLLICRQSCMDAGLSLFCSHNDHTLAVPIFSLLHVISQFVMTTAESEDLDLYSLKWKSSVYIVKWRNFQRRKVLVNKIMQIVTKNINEFMWMHLSISSNKDSDSPTHENHH